MSIQWTIIAGYLYLEVAIVILMILPIFGPKRWNRFFESRIFSMFKEHAAAYFYVLLGVLSLFLIDAIREMNKYSHSSETGAPGNLAIELKSSVKLFRSQRNFYITGFAIFLAFVIRRLVTMLIIQCELTMRAELITKKAAETVRDAKETVLAHKHSGDERCPEAIKLEGELRNMEKMLKSNEAKMQSLEEECEEWKVKYLEARDMKDSGVRG